MAGVTITVDDAEVQALFDRLAGFGGQPMRDTLADIGRTLMGSMQDRARQEIGPDGIPWVDLSARYAKRKKKLRPGLPILKFTGQMLGERFSYQLGDDYVDIGTSSKYGATHQFGRGAIPARPFLGLSDDDATEIRTILAEHLQAAIDVR